MFLGILTSFFQCTLSDCNKPLLAKGLCRFHYKKKYRESGYLERENLLQRIRRHKNIKKTRQQCNDWHRNNHDKINKWQNKHRKENRQYYNQKYKNYMNKLAKSAKLKVKTLKWALWNWNHSIKERDQNLCQICNKKGIHAHHIFPKIKYPLLILNLNNGITLCHDCHWELHKLN